MKLQHGKYVVLLFNKPKIGEKN